MKAFELLSASECCILHLNDVYSQQKHDRSKYAEEEK